jgi:hypothetical protein
MSLGSEEFFILHLKDERRKRTKGWADGLSRWFVRKGGGLVVSPRASVATVSNVGYGLGSTAEVDVAAVEIHVLAQAHARP